MASVSKMLAAVLGYAVSWLATTFPWLNDTALVDSTWVQGLAGIIVTAVFVYFAPANKS